ncbi:hypothetical protein D3C72_1585620 [compost metagenome]
MAIYVDEFDLHLRIAALESCKQRWQEVAQHRVGSPHTHASPCRVAEEQRLAQGVLQRIEDMPRMLGKLIAFGRQCHAIGQAVEQANAHSLFQMLHRGGNGRL